MGMIIIARMRNEMVMQMLPRPIARAEKSPQAESRQSD